MRTNIKHVWNVVISNFIDGCCNSDHKDDRKTIVGLLTHELLDDGDFTLRHIKRKDALALVNLLEQFAHTGKRPVEPTKGEKIG